MVCFANDKKQVQKGGKKMTDEYDCEGKIDEIVDKGNFSKLKIVLSMKDKKRVTSLIPLI